MMQEGVYVYNTKNLSAFNPIDFFYEFLVDRFGRVDGSIFFRISWIKILIYR